MTIDDEAEAIEALLAHDEPDPVELLPGAAASPFFITCDHASLRLPRALGTLGLSPAALESHIAWDIGAAGVARRLAAALGATAVLQRYSRLVIDCNRPPGSPDSVVTRSEATDIPGNRGLPPSHLEARRHAVFEPYHRHIALALDRRTAAGLPTILIALHSFTPVYLGIPRPWHVGVLYQRDPRLGIVVRDRLRADPALVVGDNQPYAVDDHSDYGVIHHGERRGNLHVELELRQDLIAEPIEQARWADRLAEIFRNASAVFPAGA
jgi:predicted N-formylglutamate amidohydrolase